MLKPWHKEDVFNVLQHRGWAQPVPLDYPQDWYYVGEAWSASRLNKILKLYFVADFGTASKGPTVSSRLPGAWLAIRLNMTFGFTVPGTQNGGLL